MKQRRLRFLRNGSEEHARPFFVLLPVCLAVVLSVGWLAPRFVMVLKDNLESNPDGWRGIMPLAVVMGVTSFLLVMICAFIAAAVGFFLQMVLTGRPSGRMLRNI